ncbi:MAG: hypothetical protein QXZ20_00820 [Candidatus Aenigmatarchaeota archaeon]
MYYKRLIFSILFIFLVGFVVAEENVKLIEYDLGKISSEKLVKLEFKFKEEFKGLTSLCSCIKAKIYRKKEENNIFYSIVYIELDPYGYRGDLEQDLILLKENGEVITLRLKAFVEEK